MNVEESNKLIAEFMGLKTITLEKFRDILRQNREDGMIHTGNSHVIEDLEYHTSWDLLMPVVEKINTIDEYKFTVCINYHYTNITETNGKCKEIVDECGYTTINGTYKAVVQFIKWYNENKED